MKVIVCLRPVPDPASRLFVNEDRTWIKDAELSFVTNEADTHACEAALELCERVSASRSEAGEVVVLSIGRDRAARVLREGLAMGAARAIHLADDGFEGGDEYVRARMIARAVEKDGGADVLLTGVQSDDLGGGVTGVMAAELLGWAHASVVVGVDAVEAGLRVRRELEGGLIETLELATPCVLTIQLGINQPRYATLRGIMAAKKKEMKTWSRGDLGMAAGDVGSEGALCQVTEVRVPERDHRVQMLSGSPAEAAARLVEKLRLEAKVI